MITLYSANVLGKADNVYYPNRCAVSGETALADAVGHDYVCAEYRNGYRSNDNFIRADCLPLDCDNDHSDDPAKWIYPSTVAQAFPEVAFAIHYSRHHWKPKNARSARPRFHVLFSCSPQTDMAGYARLKQRVNGVFPYFDHKAMDAARFFFGTAEPVVQYYDGRLTIDAFLDAGEKDPVAAAVATALPAPSFEAASGAYVIREGSRNATLSQEAAKLLKRHGVKAAEARFRELADRCEPQLPEQELTTIWRSACKFYQNRIMVSDDYIPPEDFGKVSLKPDSYTDLGQAQMLRKEYGGVMRYSPGTGWIGYDGRVWRENKLLAQENAQLLAARQCREASMQLAAASDDFERSSGLKLQGETPTKLRNKVASFAPDELKDYEAYKDAAAYMDYATSRQNSKQIANAIVEAAPLLRFDIDALDRDPLLLNAPFATWDLTTGTPQPHDPGDLITHIATCDPSDMGAGLWASALDTFFCGDAELIDYVQRICGLAAVGQVYLEALIIAYGDGRNGKSTFWNTVGRVLGDYAGVLSSDVLVTGTKRNVKPELAELRGKRLVIAGELEEGQRLSTALVKQMCSTDPIEVEKKYKDPFSFTPTHTLVLYTNHLPKVRSIDPGTWRRLIVIPFNAKIEGDGEVKNYADYLFTMAGGAVMSWILEGARKVIGSDYKVEPPAVVRKAMSAYQEQGDWLTQFLEECCVLGEEYQTASGKVYEAYLDYCDRLKEYRRNAPDFYAALDSVEGIIRRRTAKARIICGLRLKDEFERDDS